MKYFCVLIFVWHYIFSPNIRSKTYSYCMAEILTGENEFEILPFPIAVRM